MKMRTQKIPPAHVQWSVEPSPVGKLLVGSTTAGVCRLSFLKNRLIADVLSEWKDMWPQTTFTKKNGDTDLAHSAVLLVGTDFQHAVWRRMAKIPPGKVMTYGEVAKQLGAPKASRAVGTACGANPVAYLVPCHRVVAADGGLGGFSSGIEIKIALLKAEGVTDFHAHAAAKAL